MKVSRLELVERAHEFLDYATLLLEVATKDDSLARMHVMQTLEILTDKENKFPEFDHMTMDELEERYQCSGDPDRDPDIMHPFDSEEYVELPKNLELVYNFWQD